MMEARILIVDDDPDARMPIEEFLLHAGFTPSSVSSAEEAFDFIKSNELDVVISDISLPGMDGLALTEQIKKSYDIDVIVMTGYTTDYSYETAVDKGASDLIFKPVRFKELILRLKRVLRERQLSHERTRILGELQNLAITDGLTKLYNSRHFYNQLELEIDRAIRYRHQLSLLLFDIDLFKQYNDTYGHLEGDKVLIRIGQTVKTCLRTMDSAYRYGGEEFTVVLPETGGEEAITVAERIKNTVESEKFIQNSKIITITISIGVTQYVNKEKPSSFVKRADDAMYNSKQQGRNRVSYLSGQ